MCGYLGGVLTGSAGWQLHPSHFAERHGLVVIIALGEAFISIGIGATGIGIRPVTRGRFVAAVALLLVLPFATAVPALAALAIVTAVWLGLDAYELIWRREARAQSRSALASP